MARQVASLYGVLSLRDDDYQRGLQSARIGILDLGAQFDNLGASLQGLGAGLTAMTAPLVAVGVVGVQTAMAYEDALNEIRIRGQLTETQMQAVTASIENIGATSQFSMSDASNAFLQLLTSGSSVEEALIQIEAVMAGASASGETMGYTADALTNIMASFGLEAQASADVMQTLIDAEGASSATFSSLVQGFANVGPVASQFGLSFEEVSATLAEFSEVGISGAEAGTQLRSMLTSMYRNVPEATETWDRLGIALYDSEGNIRDLNTIIEELNIALDGVSEAERVNVLTTLGGSFGQMGLGALIAQDGYDEMLASMENGADITDIAQQRMSIFSGAIEFLKGSVEALQIEAFTPFMQNVLQPLVMQIADVVNGITTFASENQALVQNIFSVILGLAVAGPSLFALGTAISAVSGAMRILGTVMTVALNPVTLLIAGVALAITAYTQNLGGFRDFVDTQVAPAVMGLGDSISAMWTNAQPQLVALGNWFTTEALPAVMSYITDTAMPVFQTFVDFFAGLWDGISPALTQLSDWFMTSVLPAVITFVTDTAIPAFQGFVDFLAGIWEVVSPALGEFFNWWASEAFPQIVDFVTGPATDAFSAISDLIGGIWNAISPYLTQLYDWFMSSGLPAIVDFIGGTVTSTFNNFIGLISGITSGVASAITAVGDFFGLTGGGEEPAPSLVSPSGVAPSTAPSGATRAESGVNTRSVTSVNINVSQREGESSETLARRIAEEMQMMRMT